MLTKKDIESYIEKHHKEMEDFLSEILSVPSITGDEVAVCQVFKKRLEKMGLNTQIIGISENHPNLLAKWDGKEPGKSFLFNGHMDVFPPVLGTEELAWSGFNDGSYIHGRGASDMKGGDAAAMMCLEMLKNLGFEFRGSITMSLMCDEENGGGMGVKYLVNQGLLNADFGICMEPSNMDLIMGHTGIYRTYITYKGEPASSYRPHHKNIDALQKSVIAMNELYKLKKEIEARNDPIYGCPSLAITTIKAGNATNVYATESCFSIDRRMVLGETHEGVKNEICERLDALKNLYPDMDYTMETISERPFLETDENSEIVKAIEAANFEKFQRPIKKRRRHGGSDAASIYAKFNTQIPNMGPGQEKECAKEDEKLCIKDYLDMIEIYALTILHLLQI